MQIGFLILRTGIRWLPWLVIEALGRCAGYLAYRLLGRYRRLTLTHLRYAFGPALSRRTAQGIARRVFSNLGKTALEWFAIERYSPVAIGRLADVHGVGHLRRCLEKGRGVIAVSAHFGNWELLALVLAGLGFEGGVLARRLRYPEYESFLLNMRQRNGVATYARGSLKEAVQVLRANHILGVVPDQDTESLDGVFVEFFGHPAYTPVGPAALSLVSGAPIVPCFVIRRGRRFRLVIEEPIDIVRSGDRAKDLVEMTQAWTRVVESYIRCYPDQWAWMHRRWKTQPSETPTTSHRATQDGIAEPAAVHARIPQPALLLALSLLGGLGVVVGTGCGRRSLSQTHQPAAPVAEAEQTSAGPTQAMDGFTMVGYTADGGKRWELHGKGASAEGEVVTIKQPDAVGYQPDRKGYLTASLARVNQTNRRILLEHDVRLHTSDGLWLASPQMYWIPDSNQLLTDQPVRLETDHMLLRGRGAVGETELRRAIIERDIELVLNPSRTESQGGNSHVLITCDGPLTFDYDQNIATFEQHVHVHDDQGDLYSDHLVAYMNDATRTIAYAEATGHVRVVQGQDTAFGQRAVYEPAKGKVTLLGAPSLLVYPQSDQPSAPLLPTQTAYGPAHQ